MYDDEIELDEPQEDPPTASQHEMVTLATHRGQRFQTSGSLVIDDAGVTVPRSEAEAILAEADSAEAGLVFQVNNAKEGE